jgi:FAD-NAD(P)-binding
MADDMNPSALVMPRKVFGMYLKSCSIELEEDIRSFSDRGLKIEQHLINKEVVDIKNGDESTLVIKTADGGSYCSDFAILATGHIENTEYSHLLECPGYFHNPHREEKVIAEYVASLD